MKKIFTLLFFATLFFVRVNAQTVTLSVIQPECNNDGILQATVSGITPPYDIALYEDVVDPLRIVSTQTNVAVVTTQFSNLAGSRVYWPGNYQYIAQITQGTSVVATSPTVTLPTVINVATPWMTSLTYSCPASTASVSLAISGGVAPYNIAWVSWNGILNTSNPCNLPAGDYNYIITDANGCQFQRQGSPGMTMPVYVSYNSGITLGMTTTAANCTNGTSSVTTISGGTAPYSYLWDDGTTANFVNNSVTGWRSVTVTDANGCYQWENSYIAQTPTINVGTTVIDASCLWSNGSATVFASGGQAPYAYQWQGGQTTQIISNQFSGYYSVRATDANGCIGGGDAYIQHTTPVVVTVTSSVSQCTAATGSSTLSISGGTPPYSITWNVFPAQTGLVLSNMPPGIYNFKVTDVNGCEQHGSVNIGSVSNLAGSILASSATCNQSNGAAQFNLYSSGSGPYTYQWSNGAVTSTIASVPSGVYTCTLTDAANCKLVKTEIIHNTSPILIGVNSTPASCLFTPDGAITTNVTNGTPPYTYQWSNGATTPNLTGQLPGHYYLTVTDAAGCVKWDYNYLGYLNSNCYCVLTGTVYNDANTNCTLDAGETGIPHAMINCPTIGYSFADANGVYSFTVPAGTYTLTEHLNSYYQVTGCQTNSVVVISNPSSSCVINNDFANTQVAIHDLHVITTSVNQAVPGNNYQQKIIVVNEGAFPENNIQLSYGHDGQLGFLSSTLPLTQPNVGTYPNWYEVNSSFTSLSPLESSVDIVNYFVPTNIPMGTVVNFKDTVASMAPLSSSWVSDYSPWDNVNSYNTTVVSSYDPNFKEVTPKGTGPYGIISYNDTVLEYIIHFQNTGTYYAQNIYVTDTLDSDLDWESFTPGYSDHVYSASMSTNGVVRFAFNNINLAYYGDASNAMVSYRIKTKKNLLPGTEFRNKAAIFFDYNDPIITNTTINSLEIHDDLTEMNLKINSLRIYPNPATDLLHVSLPEGNGVLSVFNLLGEELLFQKINSHTSLNISQYPQGVYILKYIDSKGSSQSSKFIKN